MKKTAAYHELLSDFIDTQCGRCELIDRLDDLYIFRRQDWQEGATALGQVGQAGQEWEAQMLLVDRDHPCNFLKRSIQRCRTCKLASIVASYNSKLNSQKRIENAGADPDLFGACWN